MFTQHERELMIDAVLSEDTKKIFTEEYFYNLLKYSTSNTDETQLRKTAKAGVESWARYTLTMDESRQIPASHQSILGSIINNYCLGKFNQIRNKGLNQTIRREILDNIRQYVDICDKIQPNYPQDNLKQDLDSIEKEFNL